MGTSAYEQYLAEKDDSESVYAKYLASRTERSPQKPLTAGELERLRKTTALINKIEMANAIEGEPTYLDRLGIMTQRGAAAMGPLGRTIPTAVRYATKRVIGEPETWNEAAAANAADVARGGEEAPGIKIPVLGRMTLADLPAGAFAFGKYLKAMPSLSVPQIGALFAGGSRATAPEDESIVRRASGTAGHAIVGAVIPKVIGGALEVPRMGAAWWRSSRVPSVDRNIVGRDISLNAVGGPLYKMFTDIGNLPRTKKLSSVLESDLVQETIARIRKNDPSLNNVPDTNAQLLHQVYREIGNKAFNAQHGIDPTPLRASLASALDDAAVAMGESYAVPLAVWRRGNLGMEAVQRGSNVLRNAARGRTAPSKVLEESPAAFEREYGGSSKLGTERTAAAEGVLGELGAGAKVVRKGIFPVPSPNLRAAPDLLNLAESGTVSPLGTLSAWLRGAMKPSMGGTTASQIPRNPPAPPTPPKMLPAGARPMPSGELRALPTTTTPELAPRALLPSKARWGHGPDTPSKAFIPGKAGQTVGPPIPSKGSLSNEEIMRRIWLAMRGSNL